MAANNHILNNGTGMVYAGEKPWHGLGIHVANDCGFDDFMEKAGMNTRIYDSPVYGEDSETGEKLKLSDSVMRREHFPDGSRLTLCQAGHKTSILQNPEAFSFFKTWHDEKQIQFETAGRLDDGNRVWIMAKINRPEMEIRPNDFVESYLMLSNSHDGSMSVRAGFTPVRIVCQNTLSAAIASEKSKLIRVRHSKKVLENVMKVRDIIDVIQQGFMADVDTYKALAACKSINAADVRKYIQVVFKMDEDKEFGDLPPQSRDKIREIEDKFNSTKLGNGQGSVWDLYNAVTEQLTHAKGRTAKNRFDSLNFGNAYKLNADALRQAVILAA